MNQRPTSNNDAAVNSEEDWLAVVRQKVSALRFGVVQVVVHECRVVQIECTEKVRLDKPGRDTE
ncbi:MAG TPA: YezD family protein [Verrucomicrobiae bacterium]